MFIHVFFLFPETAQKPLEEVDEIFDDTTPGSLKLIGTPAWKTHVDSRTARLERGERDEEAGMKASTDEGRLSGVTATGTRTDEPEKIEH